jgi:hypothetical protein
MQPLVLEVKWVFGFTAMTLFPWLVLVKKGTPLPNRNSLLVHERVHIRQQLKYSWVYSILRYFLDTKWRGYLECEAYATEVRSLMRGAFGRDGQEMLKYYSTLLRERYGVKVPDQSLQQEIARWVRHGS